MDHVCLGFLNLFEELLLFVSVYGLSDIFVNYMKLNMMEKIYYYTFLGFIGLFIFTLTVYY